VYRITICFNHSCKHILLQFLLLEPTSSSETDGILMMVYYSSILESYFLVGGFKNSITHRNAFVQPVNVVALKLGCGCECS